MSVMVSPRQLVREMSVRQAIEWAFADECASLDFDETGAHEFSRPGLDSTVRVWQRGLLGCRIDGGGRSDPHPDAELIAAAVAALPDEQGGRAMALRIVELARARNAPDWRVPERRGVVPCGWDLTDEGEWVAATRMLDRVTYRNQKRREFRSYRPVVCPVSYSGSAHAVSAARRGYLAWYGALLHLGFELGSMRGLTAVQVTGALPELSPWNRG